MMYKVLVVGLGSMGKRRIRCLKKLGINNIFGFDNRSDRNLESEKLYNIKTFNNFEEACTTINPQILIISVSPAEHLKYMNLAIQNGIHFFVEASVLDDGLLDIIKELKSKNLVACPSSTLIFHPAIKMIKSIINSGELGKISNILVHSGQFLPDWHVYENVSDFYVSNPLTGGAREIVPFELTWFTDIFGYPRRVAGNCRKTIHITGAEYIDDTYNALLDYGNFLAVLTVDVVSRHATRRLLINGDVKQLIWSWDDNCIKIFDSHTNSWENRIYQIEAAHDGYNKNITEEMYVEELGAFFEAVENNNQFVNNLEKDYNVLQLLYKIEESNLSSNFTITNFKCK